MFIYIHIIIHPSLTKAPRLASLEKAVANGVMDFTDWYRLMLLAGAGAFHDSMATLTLALDAASCATRSSSQDLRNTKETSIR